ncbi:MAG: HAMP domain-containing histidine kinase [bacterium]|nr:HAMP domain-containing histidine kinase [bacterium]
MKWRKVIVEFLKAGLRRGSYDPRRNVFIIFGFLWGLPIPIFSLYFGLMSQGMSFNLANTLIIYSSSTWEIFFLLHPFIFAGVFGILGTVYMGKEQQVSRLLVDLRVKLKELKRANRDLEELDQMKDEFLSNVTHELKTPLVTIQGYTEMLLSSRLGDLSDKQVKALEVMNRNQVRLSELILQLLRYGKMEEHMERILQAEISIHKLFKYLKNSFKPGMEKKKITYRVDLPEEDVQVLGQEDMIEQVMRNLIANARKFTDRGGHITVSTDMSRYPREVGVVVEDDGCGISEDALPYIFERFRQGDGSVRRKYGGTGLGLAIVKKVLDAHKTEVAVQSELGEGTRFVFFLTVAKVGPSSTSDSFQGVSR